MKTLVSLRNLLLFGAAAIVLAAIPVSERLKFDQRIEAFFASDNPDLLLLQRNRSEFGGSEFVIVAWTEDQLFAMPDQQVPQSLAAVLEIDVLLAVDDPVAQKIRDVSARLNEIPGVNGEKTQHLADLLDAAPRLKSSRRAMLRLFEGTMVGRDGRTTGILLELRPQNESTESRAATLEKIRKIAASMDGEVAVAGEPVQVFDMFQMVEEDGQILFLVSLSILSLVLLMMFQGFRWVLAPVGLVLGSVVVTRATLSVIGAELSMV
ncbi:MAG: MMPL family transporter, partial [Fuerstiella sp.]